MIEINWDRAKLEALKDRMRETSPVCPFTFEGNIFLRGYAKHLVKYLETKLGRNS